MAQNRQQRRVKQNGNVNGSQAAQFGANQTSTPATNRGVKSGNETGAESPQSGTDRTRVNVSLPAGVYASLAGSSEKLGTSISQMALSAIMAGLPSLADQVEAVERLK